MHDIIYHLLRSTNDDFLISLCNLLTTAGCNLDKEKAKPRMDQYISQLTKIAENCKPKIKFRIWDVMELRQNNWVPRKNALVPKTIDEVRKDFVQEREQEFTHPFASESTVLPGNDNSEAGRSGHCGRIVYSRDFLMELRNCAASLEKPKGLPHLEIILDRSYNHQPRTLKPVDFIPIFFDTAKLQRLEQLENQIIFILNCLTPANVQQQAVKMQSLKIMTYEDLQFMVKIIFDKVTMETKSVDVFAQLCKAMRKFEILPQMVNGSDKDKMTTFHSVLLTMSQEEFDANKSVIFEDTEMKIEELKKMNPDTSAERREVMEETIHQMILKRMRVYGNIRFVGELFKVNMLPDTIILNYIMKDLIQGRSHSSLECLCSLLTTVGRSLDTEKAKTRMDQYFSQMALIAKSSVPSIKSLLMDVIKLRQNNWVPL